MASSHTLKIRVPPRADNQPGLKREWTDLQHKIDYPLATHPATIARSLTAL
jgi:hypothetical protein